jgi:hypothetical protein
MKPKPGVDGEDHPVGSGRSSSGSSASEDGRADPGPIRGHRRPDRRLAGGTDRASTP